MLEEAFRGSAMALTKYRLGDLIEQCNERDNGTHVVEDVRGISTGKEFIETKANMDGVSLSSYKVVRPGEFAYVADTSRRGDKIALAFNASEHEVLISSIYTAFRVKSRLLLSDYLFMFFNRPEFDRFSRFNSWGSARETFDWNDFCDIDIALPPVSIQQKYVDIYNAMLANQQSYEHGLADLKLVCDAYIEDLRKNVPLKQSVLTSNDTISKMVPMAQKMLWESAHLKNSESHLLKLTETNCLITRLLSQDKSVLYRLHTTKKYLHTLLTTRHPILLLHL